MRAFEKGKPFLDVPSDHHVPTEDDLDEMRRDIGSATADGSAIPVFSETYLYPRLGKEDARFVLGIAAEYDHLINCLGQEGVRELLEAPRRRQRPRDDAHTRKVLRLGHDAIVRCSCGWNTTVRGESGDDVSRLANKTWTTHAMGGEPG